MKHFIFGLMMLISTQLSANTGIPQIPQIPAFLPMAHTVPQTAITAIDGEWMITSIGKRVRIQAGRAYAIDPWVHMFVLKVQPMMVVIKDIKATGGRSFTGNDLPLIGTWNAQLGSDGNLSVSVQTMVGPLPYTMMPVRMDDQDAFDRAKGGVGDQPEQPEPAPDPVEDGYEDSPHDEMPEQEEEEDWDDWDQ